MSDNSTNTLPKTTLKGRKLAYADAFLALPDAKGRITQAAVNIGLSGKAAQKQGSKWRKMGDVDAYIRERMGAIRSHIEDKQLVTAEMLVNRLHKIYEQCMEGEPEMVWESGELVHSGKWTFDSKGACRAVELLGNYISMFDPKKDDKKEAPFSLNIIMTEPEKKQPAIEHQSTPTINMESPT